MKNSGQKNSAHGDPVSGGRTISRRAFLAAGGAAVVGLAAWRLGALRELAARRGLADARFVAMGTYLELTLPEAAGSRGFTAAVDAVRRVEERMSFFRADSELNGLNRAAAGAVVPLSDELVAVLAASRETHAVSAGAFDPTVAPLLAAWGFHDGRPTHRPGRDELRAARERCGLDKLDLTARGARLGVDGMSVDLGGIAKGYAVDQAAAALGAAGTTGLVNAGGDIRAAGARPDGAPWRVGVRDPFAADAVFAELELPAGRAVATSGTYEQGAEIDGRRVSHILDPRSGEPTGSVVSATVTAPTAMEADALATACIVLEPAEALAMLARRRGVEGLLVARRADGKHRVETTAGMRCEVLRAV